jgi:phosphoribosylformylglycinamidine synthase
VQGGSVIKPLQGVTFDGPGDASITRPILDSRKGIILGCGINPDFGKIDPYWMAASVIDEALRQIVSVGGDIERCAILDNFCWGNTNKPDRLGGLVRASIACYDTAKKYGVPFISGKDSLNNEYSYGRKTISIPPTLLISCIAVMDDVKKAVTMDLKGAGNAVYLIGITNNELGGSQYFKMRGYIGNNVPKVDAAYGRRLMLSLSRAIGDGLVRSCHDCSEGGMAVALAEMAFSGGFGMDVRLDHSCMPRGQRPLNEEILLFSESNTRFLLEIEPAKEKRFTRSMKGIPAWKIGQVINSDKFRIFGQNGRTSIDTDILELKKAWQKPFKDY